MLPLRDNLKITGFPVITALLVAINVLVFFVWQGGSRLDVDKVILYGTIPYEVTHPGKQCAPANAGMFECKPQRELEQRYHVKFPPTWETLFASMFMHLSIGHLIGNMLFLVVFGISLEAGLGRRSFALFYLVGGLGADVAHTLFNPSSPIPALGASGAISAVMGGYVMLYPRAKIFTWVIPPLPFVWGWIRAAWLIGVLMALQAVEAYFLLATAYGGSGGGVAYFAHFGGFAAGAMLVMAVLDRESIEQLRHMARIASGDQRAPRDNLELGAERIYPAAAAASAQPTYAQPAAGQPAYAQPAVAGAANAQPVYAQAAAAPAAHRRDPFVPPPAAAVPTPAAPVPIVPRPAAPPQTAIPPQAAAPEQPAPPPAARPRPAPGSLPRPPGC